MAHEAEGGVSLSAGNWSRAECVCVWGWGVKAGSAMQIWRLLKLSIKTTLESLSSWKCCLSFFLHSFCGQKNQKKPSDIFYVNPVCTSLLKLHCHIFNCVLLTQRNTIQMCSQASGQASKLFCVLTRGLLPFLSPVQSLGAALLRLAAVSRVGWSKLRKRALPGQRGHAAQRDFGDVGYYQQTSASFVDRVISQKWHTMKMEKCFGKMKTIICIFSTTVNVSAWTNVKK